MTKLKDGSLMDLLRDSVFVDNVKAKCISYALESETKRLLECADSTLTSAGIDKLPERILDYLAVELRSPYYDEDFDISRKRETIKNTLKWYMLAGTPAAMDELIDVAFGGGNTIEWPKYGGVPGHFKVEVREQMTPEKLSTFVKTIDMVKRAGAVLDSVDVVSPARGLRKIGAFNASVSKNVIIMEV